MKAFFWKPFIKDPAKEEHKTVLWAKVEQHPITDDFMEKVVEAFHDKRALAAKSTAAVGVGDVIKVTGPTMKQYFTPEESKNI